MNAIRLLSAEHITNFDSSLTYGVVVFKSTGNIVFYYTPWLSGVN